MSFNQSMSINLNSMKNNQYALAVVSQNIANLHVEGYHRQRVNFVTNDYTTNCENVISTIKGMNGASISSLSDFIDNADGTYEGGTSASDKRKVSSKVPNWKKENCIECNECAFICPHAVIKPFSLTEEELDTSPITKEEVKS